MFDIFRYFLNHNLIKFLCTVFFTKSKIKCYIKPSSLPSSTEISGKFIIILGI